MVRYGGGFSFIELVTVVALIGIITTSAAPVASSLFQRHREMVLRENLLTLRKAVTLFEMNLYDDDADDEIDEDPRGDGNHDGFPGIRRINDDGDEKTDEDWRNRTPFDNDGNFNPFYDWRVRRDDDEDGVVDEEAFPSDMNDLAMKVPLLHKTIPVDPTLRVASWDSVMMKDDVPNGIHLANGDFDWYLDSNSNGWRDSNEPIIISTNNVYSVAHDRVLTSTAVLADGTGGFIPLTDEDPRNHIDDDGDGRIDEDPPDLLDVASLNSAKGLNQTSYNQW